MATASRPWSIPLPNGSRISVLMSLPFAFVHLASLLIFFTPFHWYYLVTCLALLFVRMFFVTAGYHRYFSHRAFKTSRVFQFVIDIQQAVFQHIRNAAGRTRIIFQNQILTRSRIAHQIDTSV